MKKILSISFLILFVLSATAFAGPADPKKDSGKSKASNPKENKLSDEELSRLKTKVEGKYNMGTTMSSGTDASSLKKNPNQVVVVGERHHGGYIWLGGGGLLLLIILIIVLV
jgi:hypothetical protein